MRRKRPEVACRDTASRVRIVIADEQPVVCEALGRFRPQRVTLRRRNREVSREETFQRHEIRPFHANGFPVGPPLERDLVAGCERLIPRLS